MLIKYKTGDKVVFNMEALKRANAWRITMNWLSDSYYAKAKLYEGKVGTVGRMFGDYVFNLEFPDGQIFHCQDKYVNYALGNT